MLRSLFTILVFILCIFTCSFTIEGGVSYTVNQARQIAFENVENKINILKYKEYFVDKNYYENMCAIQKGKKDFKNRYITLFANGNYAITYKSDNKIGYYYNSKGELRFIEISLNDEYPFIDAKYDLKGNLDGTSLTVSKNEGFVFDLEKRLVAHWIDRYCYNENGELIDTRK